MPSEASILKSWIEGFEQITLAIVVYRRYNNRTKNLED